VEFQATVEEPGHTTITDQPITGTVPGTWFPPPGPGSFVPP
jgi:hypothetical protein